MKNSLSKDEAQRIKKIAEPLYQELNLLKIEGFTFSFDPKSADKNTPNDSLETVDDADGSGTTHTIIIEPHPKYGRPSPLAYKLMNVIFKKLSEYGVGVPSTVPFTFRELNNRIGRSSYGGRSALEIYNALVQIYSTDITCWGYNKVDGKWAILKFRIFTHLAASGTGLGEDATYHEGYIGIEPIIIHNLEKNYQQTINYSRMNLCEASPIAVALYKRIYNVFSKRYSHKQPASFSKNYQDICLQWLGGLKQWRYKSDITRQFAPHLDYLKSVKLLRSYKIEKNSTKGWKLTFNPGVGFREDYENFYRKGKQYEIPFAYNDEKTVIQEPLELVAYFYRRLHNDHESKNLAVYSPKETDLAKSILKTFAFNEAKEFIEFALAEAGTTDFDIKTLGGIRQYLPTWDKHKRDLKAKKTGEQLRREEEKEDRLKEEYKRWCNVEIKKIRGDMNPTELAGIELRERQIIEPTITLPFAVNTMVRINTNRVLREQYKIPEYEEWKKQRMQKTR